MIEIMKEQLYQKIIPFWNRMADWTNGGFYGYVGNDHVIDQYADKGAVKISRILWSYAALYLFDGNEAHRTFADHAYRYLRDVLHDDLGGGVYWKSAYDKTIKNDTKHIYAQSFAIYGLSAYAKAFEVKEALDLAMALFHVLEDKAKDGKGSYLESFDRAWRVTRNVILQTGELIPVHTTNAVIHLIEAYTALFELTQDDLVRIALTELLDTYHERIYDPKRHVSRIFFDQSWHSLSFEHSYGHDIETAWLIDKAMTEVGLHEAKYQEMTHELAQKVRRDGYRHGLIKGEGNRRASRDVVWWIQAEAAVGFYNHYQKTGNRKFYHASMKTIEKTFKLIVDSRQEGEWFWSVDRQGRPIGIHGISENWKANYHNVRSLIEMIERMTRNEIS